jgi:hypothetical protein
MGDAAGRGPNEVGGMKSFVVDPQFAVKLFESQPVDRPGPGLIHDPAHDRAI